MDESNKQLIEDTYIPLPATPGQVAKADHEYKRHGVRDIFLAVEPLAGKRITKITTTRTQTDWAYFIRELSVLSRQCLSRRIATESELKQQVAARTAARNKDHTTIDWQFTTEDARIKLKHLYPSF